MVELVIKLECPQTHNPCVGEKKCTKDKSKGCAVETLKIWQIKSEEYDEFVPWSARL